MIWFYKWSRGTVRVETRQDSATHEFVLEIEWPGRPIVVERFADAGAFDVRLRALEGELEHEGCQQLGSPEFLPYGWRGPTH